MSEREGNNVFGTGEKPMVQGIQTITTAEMLKDEFGLTIAQETVPLPSKGKIYPQNSSLYGKEHLEIRAMTTREEDILTSRALIKKGTVVNALIKSCLVDKTIDVDSMISGDRNALMVAIRITGYGPEYKTKLTCEKCGETEERVFMLDQCPIKPLDEQPVEEGQNLFEKRLTKSNALIQFKLLNSKDELEIITEQERRKKLGLKTSGAESIITDQLKASIVKINSVTDKGKIAQAVQNLPAFDSRELRKYMGDVQPGIDLTQKTECPSCGNEEEVTIPLGTNFFWPDSE